MCTVPLEISFRLLPYFPKIAYVLDFPISKTLYLVPNHIWIWRLYVQCMVMSVRLSVRSFMPLSLPRFYIIQVFIQIPFVNPWSEVVHLAFSGGWAKNCRKSANNRQKVSCCASLSSWPFCSTGSILTPSRALGPASCICHFQADRANILAKNHQNMILCPYLRQAFYSMGFNLLTHKSTLCHSAHHVTMLLLPGWGL